MDFFTVEFRIEGSSLDPEKVTKVLGLSPSLTSTLRSGILGNRSRNPFWAYDGVSTEINFVEKEWNSLEEGLTFLLGKLQPQYNLIKSQYREYKKYWWCGSYQQSWDGGPDFSPELLRKLGDFGATLMIRNYRHGGYE